ncbi:MAG TPA: aldo/keto reductase [Candidatus Deferrimicrobium sp.]|nr:aldo/keto reductase [Candidatus Deferrimicrobium sp.]
MAVLGQTGLEVSPLCFGTLTLSPLQGCHDIKAGAEVLHYALEQGINFLDTAELYVNYEVIKTALAHFQGDVVVSSKSYAYTKDQAQKSVELARRKLNRDVIEIFSLHEQESMYTLQGHQEALEYLFEAKSKGILRAVGISTHAVAGVRAAASLAEIDVIHPILNYRGLGIIDGTLEEMLAAIELAKQMGKGIYAMKALGGGHLGKNPVEALNFARSVSGVAAVAVGMASKLEVDLNLKIFHDQEVPEEWVETLRSEKRCLHIADWCEGCGRCVEKCPQAALTLSGDQVTVEHTKCVLCGYCGSACPHFCLKIIKQGV